MSVNSDENKDTLLVNSLTRLSLDWIDFSVFRNCDSSKTIGEALPAIVNLRYEKSHEAIERQTTRKQLAESIQLGVTQLNVNANEIAAEIENILFYNYFYYFEAIYYSKVRSLCFNLAKNAEYLIAHYDAEILCFFPTEALAAGTELDEWRAKYRHTLAQKMQPQRIQNKGIFECPNCHQNNTDYFKRQIRGADEPETIFVECFNCNKHFKR